MVQYEGVKSPGMKHERPEPPRRRLNMKDMRDYVRTNFEEFKWPALKVENRCVGAEKKEGAAAGAADRIIK